METPNLYKKISTVDVSNKNMTAVSENDFNSANLIIEKFVTLFKDAHM